MVNVDQVRIYHHRKSDEMEIRTGSSDSNSSRHKSSSFESIQRRSNESQSPPGSWSEPNRKLKMGMKETRSLDSGSGRPERKIKKGIGHRVAKRTSSSNNTNDLPRFRKKVRTEETVMPSTSGYNLRPRRQAKVEPLLTNEMTTQQEGPVRARKS
ncbi:uncharacterized protein TNCV_1979501 [Trichonephila clavipes]|nr:uncharacterized protein TNCV_1979501 [Trichonephila clavipes]